jgi:hypothetical protein
MDGDLEEDVLIIDMHSELISPPSGEHTVTRWRLSAPLPDDLSAELWRVCGSRH